MIRGLALLSLAAAAGGAALALVYGARDGALMALFMLIRQRRGIDTAGP